MFEIGKSYEYGGSTGSYPVLYTITNGTSSDREQREYIEEDCTLDDGSKQVKFLRGLWEPDDNSVCECISTNPLILKCKSIRCLLAPTEGEIKVRDSIKQALEVLGYYKISEEIVTILYEEFRWRIEHNSGEQHPLVVATMMIDQLNDTWLKDYGGSHNGYSHWKEYSRVAFDYFFGFESRIVIEALREAHVPMKADMSERGICLLASGVPFDQYVEKEYNYKIGGTSKVGSLLKGAEG